MALAPRVTAGLISLVVLLFPVATMAHEPPRGTAILWRSDGSMIVPFNRGIMFGSAQTKYRMMCDEHMGAKAGLNPPPKFALRSDGTLIVRTNIGFLTTQDDGCTWDNDGEPGEALRGLTPHPADEDTFYLATGLGQGDTLFVTRNGGKKWSAVAELPVDSIYEDFAIAPSDPSIIYASILSIDREKMKLEQHTAMSSDGGETWERYEQKLGTEYADISILAVDSDDPQIVFAYKTGNAIEGTDIEPRDTLVRSEDGAKTFEHVLDVYKFAGLLTDPAGDTVWAGGGCAIKTEDMCDGLWRSDDRGRTFEKINPEIREITCLEHHDGRLWVCGMWYPDEDGVTSADGVRVSDDRGESFEPVMEFPNVCDQIECEPSAGLSTTCGIAWDDWTREEHEFKPDLTSCPIDLPDAGADSGAADAGDAGESEFEDVDAGTDSGRPEAGTRGSADDDGLCSVTSVNGVACGNRALAFMLLAATFTWRRHRRAQVAS